MKSGNKKSVHLKLNIKKTTTTKIMSTSLTSSWQKEGGKLMDFIFLGFKVTADNDDNHKIKRVLLLGRKVLTNVDSVLKSNYFTDKSPYRQSYAFSSSHMWS